MSRQLGDEDIVATILETGNTALFAVLYDRYSNKVYRKCISFTKDQAAAEDLAHDIFVTVFTRLAKFQGRSRFSTWLYSITFNRCVDYSRKKSRRNFTVEYDDDLADLVADDDALDKALLETEVALLQSALEEITPEEKGLLLMKYQEDISIQELAVTIGLSESAVKMRLMRAKQRVVGIVNKKRASL